MYRVRINSSIENRTNLKYPKIWNTQYSNKYPIFLSEIWFDGPKNTKILSEYPKYILKFWNFTWNLKIEIITRNPNLKVTRISKISKYPNIPNITLVWPRPKLRSDVWKNTGYVFCFIPKPITYIVWIDYDWVFWIQMKFSDLRKSYKNVYKNLK